MKRNEDRKAEKLCRVLFSTLIEIEKSLRRVREKKLTSSHHQVLEEKTTIYKCPGHHHIILYLYFYTPHSQHPIRQLHLKPSVSAPLTLPTPAAPNRTALPTHTSVSPGPNMVDSAYNYPDMAAPSLHREV